MILIIASNRFRHLIGLPSGTRIGNCRVRNFAHTSAALNWKTENAFPLQFRDLLAVPISRVLIWTGGNDGKIASGYKLWMANVVQASSGYGNRRHHTRAGHRREHGDLHRRQCRAVTAFAVSRAGAVGLFPLEPVRS